jgi:hypothetical protein
MQRNMVVNLAVYRKCAARRDIEKGLRAVLHVNDREPLVREYCAFVCVYSAPVRPAVPDRFRHFQRAGAHRFELILEFENPDEAAQGNYPAIVLIITGSISEEDPELIYPDYDIPRGPQRGNIYVIFRHINPDWQLSITCFFSAVRLILASHRILNIGGHQRIFIRYIGEGFF